MAHDSALWRRIRQQDEIIGVLRRELADQQRSAAAARQQVARYRGLLDGLDAGLCVVRVIFEAGDRPVDYRFLEVNLAFERQTGLRAVGGTIRERVPGREAAWLDPLGRVALTGEAQRLDSPVAALGPYHRGYAFRIGAPERHTVGILFDGAIARAGDDAERDAADAQVRFLATLAHELRNPLAPLQSGLDLLRVARRRPSGSAPGADQVLDTMSRQLSILTHLVDELLDIAHISGGTVTLKRRHFDLTDAVRKGAELAAAPVRSGSRQLSVDMPSGTLAVDGDPARLAQVVAGLLENAVKFTGEAGRIRLAVARDGRMARITVEDDGVGIEPDMLEEIFGMFSQTRTDRHGLGLGLSVIRELVRLHGGTVHACSEGRGRGSRFIVELPLTPQARSAPGRPAPERRRLLVVDDNRDAADSLAALLRSMGGEVHAAYEGRSALLLLDELQPHIVFLDIGMPEMDGYEVARLIRRRDADGRVMLVAVTGWGQPADRQRAVEAGFNDHLLKPASVEDLRRIVDAQPVLS